MALTRLLIVEDTMDVGRFYQDTVRAAFPGVPITLVPSAEEALLEASRYNYDLLITDIRLPGISGFDLARKIRVRQPDVKILMITGLKSDEFLEKQTRDLKIDQLLAKPVGIADFLAAIEQLTGTHSTLNLSAVEAASAARKKSGSLRREEPAAQASPAVTAPLVRTGKTGSLTRYGSAGAQTLSGLLAELRSSLNALGVVLVDGQGGLIEMVGDWPAPDLAASLVPDVLAALKAFAKVTSHLRARVPAGAHALHGDAFDLACAAAGSGAVLVFLRGSSGALRLGLAFEHLLTVQGRLAALLAARPQPPAAALDELPVAVDVVPPAKPARVTAPLRPAVLEQPAVPEDPAALEAFSSLLGRSANPAVQDIDAFWDNAFSAETPTPANGGLSYAQAREMGLLPEDPPV